MMFLTTPEPTVRPPSRNHFEVLFTILSSIFLVFQRFCLLKACGIFVVLKFGARMEPVTNLVQTLCLNYLQSLDSCRQINPILACDLYVTCM